MFVYYHWISLMCLFSVQLSSFLICSVQCNTFPYWVSRSELIYIRSLNLQNDDLQSLFPLRPMFQVSVRQLLSALSKVNKTNLKRRFLFQRVLHSLTLLLCKTKQWRTGAAEKILFFANNLWNRWFGKGFSVTSYLQVGCFAASLKLPHYPFCLFQRSFVINYDTDQTRIYYHNVVIYKRPVFVTVLVPCSNHSAILDLQPLTNACLNVCWGFRVCGQKSLICLIFGENVVLPAQRLQGNFAPGHI